MSSFSMAHLPVGASHELLIDKMNTAKALIVIQSAASFESQTCLQEVMAAFDQKITILPLVFEVTKEIWRTGTGSLVEDIGAEEGPKVCQSLSSVVCGM